MSTQKKHDTRQRYKIRKKQAPLKPLPKAPSKPLPPATFTNRNQNKTSLNKHSRPLNNNENINDNNNRVTDHKKTSLRSVVDEGTESDSESTTLRTAQEIIDDNDNGNATETDYESSVPPKGYHKGSVVIHESMTHKELDKMNHDSDEEDTHTSDNHKRGGHQRVNSLPPKKPLPISSKKGNIKLVKSAQNTPVSPKKSVTTLSPSNGNDMPFAAVDIDELPNIGLGTQIKYSQSQILSEQAVIDVISLPPIMQSTSCVTPTEKKEEMTQISFEFNPNNPNPQSEFRKNRNLFQSQPNLAKVLDRNIFTLNHTSVSNKTMKKNNSVSNKNRNTKNVTFNQKNKNVTFGTSMYSDHPSNRRRNGDRSAIEKLKQQMAMKIKAKQNNPTNMPKKVNRRAGSFDDFKPRNTNHSNPKTMNKRAGSLDHFKPNIQKRSIQKRKQGKRKIRKNIFATAGSMTVNEQKPKFDPVTRTNASPSVSSFKISPKKKETNRISNDNSSEIPELVLTQNLSKTNNISRSDSSDINSSDTDSSDSDSSSLSSVEDKTHSKRKSNFTIQSMRHASPRFGSRAQTPKNKSQTPKDKSQAPQHRNSSNRSSARKKAVLKTIKADTPSQRSRSPFSFGQTDISTHNKSMTYADYKRIRKLEEEKQEKEEFGSSMSWILGDVIGKGAFGTVYKGMEKKSGKLIAIKEFKYTFKNRQKTLKEFEKETQIMKQLKHINICEFYSYKVDEDNSMVFLVMEYVPGNSIQSIYDSKGSFSEVMIQKYVYQIINGLHYAHSLNIIHRDIKGKNILVNNKGIVKIADFGSAILTEKDENVIEMDFESTPLWTAPECLTEGKYDLLIDIWSLGCCIIEMATAENPWHEIDFKSPFQALFHIGNTDSVPQWPKALSIQCQAFIAKCLIRDPKKRYNTKQLLQHPFLKINHKNNSY